MHGRADRRAERQEKSPTGPRLLISPTAFSNTIGLASLTASDVGQEGTDVSALVIAATEDLSHVDQ